MSEGLRLRCAVGASCSAGAVQPDGSVIRLAFATTFVHAFFRPVALSRIALTGRDTTTFKIEVCVKRVPRSAGVSSIPRCIVMLASTPICTQCRFGSLRYSPFGLAYERCDAAVFLVDVADTEFAARDIDHSLSGIRGFAVVRFTHMRPDGLGPSVQHLC